MDQVQDFKNQWRERQNCKILAQGNSNTSNTSNLKSTRNNAMNNKTSSLEPCHTNGRSVFQMIFVNTVE